MSSQPTRQPIQGGSLLDLTVECHDLIAELENAILWETSPVLVVDLKRLVHKIKTKLATIDNEIQDIVSNAKQHHSGYVAENSKTDSSS